MHHIATILAPVSSSYSITVSVFSFVTLLLMSGRTASPTTGLGASMLLGSSNNVCYMSKPGYDWKDMEAKAALPLRRYVTSNSVNTLWSTTWDNNLYFCSLLAISVHRLHHLNGICRVSTIPSSVSIEWFTGHDHSITSRILNHSLYRILEGLRETPSWCCVSSALYTSAKRALTRHNPLPR